jgi:hypothetical protein
MRIFLISLNDVILNTRSLIYFKERFNKVLKSIHFIVKELQNYAVSKSRNLILYKDNFLKARFELPVKDISIIFKKILSKETKLMIIEKYINNFKIKVKSKVNFIRLIVLNRFFINLSEVIKEISKVKHINLILNKSKRSVLYADGCLDITYEVTKILNR